MVDPKVVRLPKRPKKADTRPNWMETLILSERSGEPRACLSNAIDALRFAPEWQGVIALNEFSLSTMCLKRPPLIGLNDSWDDEWNPRQWTDTDDILTTEWFQKQGIMVQPDTTAKAVQAIAEARRYHPVREYLDSVEWDGERRLPSWTKQYLGVEPSIYTEAVGIRWMVSAVARIFEPGCKADCVLILKGEQDLGKSTALRILGGEWFGDRIADLGSKESSIDVQGVWILEFAELDALKDTALSTVKAFMSSPTDRFRPPYGRRTIDFPRQCIFAGTVNPQGGIFNDPTGGRRWWPLNCTKIDVEGLRRDRDQLWAEAVDFYQQHSVWWLDTEELKQAAEAVQADDYVGDAWDDRISDYLLKRDEVTVSELLEKVIGIKPDKQEQKHLRRMGSIMTSMKWKKCRLSKDENGKRPNAFRRP